MQAQLTEFLLKLTFSSNNKETEDTNSEATPHQESSLTSSQIFNQIYDTLNSQKNYKDCRDHKLSLSSQDTTPQVPTKCNCKKSKCLKLYCECFARGSFCKDCNCECCQNTKQFIDVRAQAIDEMMTKVGAPFGCRTSSMKGCNCKKTGCQKKYCECFNQGNACNQWCKCSNCQNCPP